MHSAIKSLFFILTASLSGQILAKDLGDISTFPDWFQNAMARESEVSDSTTLTIESLGVNSTIKGAAQLIEQGDGTWYYTIDIGTDSPVECYAFLTFDGAANSLDSVLNYAIGNSEQVNNKKLNNTFIYAVGTGILEDTPYMQMDKLYILSDGKETVSGLIKGLSAKTDNSLQICMHNELGYRKTFQSVFESFTSAFVKTNSKNAFFKTVYRMTVNEMPVGYLRESYTKDADGDVHALSESVFLMPVDDNNVSRTDSVSESWNSPDGSLINTLDYTVENGVLSSRFALSNRDGKWNVDGEMQGKKIATPLEHSSWILSDFGSYLEVKALMESDKDSIVLDYWASEADPTSITQMTVSKVKDDENANIQVDFGPMSMRYLADENAIMQNSTMQIGPITIYLEPMYIEGMPVIP